MNSLPRPPFFGATLVEDVPRMAVAVAQQTNPEPCPQRAPGKIDKGTGDDIH